MDKEQNKMSIVWFVVVILVVSLLIYITINKKVEAPALSETGKVEDTNTNKVMPETKQIGGVKITFEKEGTGSEAKNGDTVAMNYTGTLANGTTFDSNVDPKFQHVQPFIFKLGAGQVIKGWDVGVLGMKAGEKRKLEITPEYGYGERGAGGAIPPNATLTFEVELLAIK